MIKFFRRIRQKLLSENKFSKYFIYAIGEIVLVVIGILIALSINNWNQQRIALNEEKVLLNILKDDFTNRLDELIYLRDSREEGVLAIEKLINIADGTTTSFTAEDVDSLLALSIVTYRFNNQFSTLDMLFNSGRINTLSNDSLKGLLIKWPTLVEEMLEEQRLIVDHYNEQIKILDEYVALKDIFQYFAWNNYEMPRTKGSKLQKDYKGLFADRSFENSLASKRFLLSINIADSEVIIKDAKEIIVILKSELTK